ncbi:MULTISPECIES: glycosyltransferase family 4 protein [unclassified Iodidimonas]|jgi:glycosyltransferase involved in cell wall biosynthesis|uniref:glycosyltransferase family 4 protein n=1 Tax=unclassified Iodidimonas TaxID=2626145 RepID=UPI0024826C41|nr:MULTISPECIES: glycosyltransferase family 4 protein [unclassified Iodidimonas]
MPQHNNRKSHEAHQDGRGVIRSVAVISNQARSMLHHRGPLIAAMIGCGVRVYALAPDHDATSRAEVEALGAVPVDYRLDRTGMNPLRDLGHMLRLSRLLRRLDVDGSFGYFIKPVIYGSLAAWLAGVPHRFALIAGLGYVFTDGDTPPDLKKRFLKMIVSLLYRLALHRCTQVFFENGDDLQHFATAGHLPRGVGLNVHGTGVYLDHYAHVPPPMADAPPVFLLVARLLREKGLYEFAEAARRIKARHPAARFVLLGGLDDNPGSLTQETVQGWVQEGIIEWPGAVADVRPYLVASSVFVLPSWREGLPRSTTEALATGRAVITSDAPGCRDTVIAGENGLLVPVRDPAALAAAMQHFIDHPEDVARMGAASRALAEARFDVHKINATILQAMGIAPAA